MLGMFVIKLRSVWKKGVLSPAYLFIFSVFQCVLISRGFCLIYRELIPRRLVLIGTKGTVPHPGCFQTLWLFFPP